MADSVYCDGSSTSGEVREWCERSHAAPCDRSFSSEGNADRPHEHPTAKVMVSPVERLTFLTSQPSGSQASTVWAPGGTENGPAVPLQLMLPTGVLSMRTLIDAAQHPQALGSVPNRIDAVVGAGGPGAPDPDRKKSVAAL